MAKKVVMEYVVKSKEENQTVELCQGEINGARPVHHQIKAGSEMVFEKNVGYYHILILITGEAAFATDDKEFKFTDRTTFVPATDKDLVVKADTDSIPTDIDI